MNVTIIGGADGPTSIFIAGKTGGADIFILAAALAAVIGLGIFLWKKRKH